MQRKGPNKVVSGHKIIGYYLEKWNWRGVISSLIFNIIKGLAFQPCYLGLRASEKWKISSWKVISTGTNTILDLFYEYHENFRTCTCIQHFFSFSCSCQNRRNKVVCAGIVRGCHKIIFKNLLFSSSFASIAIQKVSTIPEWDFGLNCIFRAICQNERLAAIKSSQIFALSAGC